MDSSTTLHAGLAEQGKLHAVAGDHSLALLYYREAIRMVASTAAHEVFFRHYLECSLESLEKLEAYQEVLAYCEKAIQFYAKQNIQDPEKHRFIQVDLAHLNQRRGVILFKRGDKQLALESLQTADRLSRTHGIRLDLTTTLLGWMQRGMHIDNNRVLAEQNARNYFSVRREQLHPERAIRLSDTQIQHLQGRA